MDQSDYINHAGVKSTSLPLITEPSGTEVIMIGGSHPLRNIGVSLDYTTTEPPIIHSDQATAVIYRWGDGDRNVSIISLESCIEVRRGGIGRSINDGNGMNPPKTIVRNGPHSTGKGGSNLFYSVTWISDFSIRSASCNSATMSENAGHDSLFKTAGREGRNRAEY